MRKLCVAVVLFLAATPAMASWYDDYDAGLKAARNGQWSTVISKMSAAINAHPKEGNNERTYGAIFINYHPYYYRGVAYLNTGKYEQAVSDFEKTSGPGEADLGPLGDLMRTAKSKLEASSTPEPAPQPVPQPVRPAPTPVPLPPTPVPAAPAIDPGLRQHVAAAISAANSSLANARNRKAATSPMYAQAVTAVADANTRMNSAKSNDDLNAALASAQNAQTFADSAVAPGQTPIAVATNPPPTKTVAATAAVFSDYMPQLRNALTNYFNGEFEAAANGFELLTRSLPKNGWVWAFLGASRYSQYAFEGDEAYKRQAVEAFKNAKTYRKWNNGLPDRYFSKRIRKFFTTLG